jgi:hypothetical protein
MRRWVWGVAATLVGGWACSDASSDQPGAGGGAAGHSAGSPGGAGQRAVDDGGSTAAGEGRAGGANAGESGAGAGPGGEGGALGEGGEAGAPDYCQLSAAGAIDEGTSTTLAVLVGTWTFSPELGAGGEDFELTIHADGPMEPGSYGVSYSESHIDLWDEWQGQFEVEPSEIVLHASTVTSRVNDKVTTLPPQTLHFAYGYEAQSDTLYLSPPSCVTLPVDVGIEIFKRSVP